MSSTTSPVRLTAPQRFARGVKYSTVGPIDVTRGAVGVGVNSVRSSAAWVGNRYRRSPIADQLAAAQDVVVTLPRTLQETRRRRRRPRPVVLIGAGIAVLAVGAVSFSIIRRSTQPDPSPLPPSVDVTPRP